MALYLFVDAGTRDELPHQAGAAHLLEHMLFKGTHAHEAGEAALTIEALGGDLNAFTALEHTVLHATLPAEGWREALEVLVELVRRPRLETDELRQEREVVLEELRGDEDDPEAVLEQSVRARLFPEHPYARRLLGTSAAVAGLTAADLRAHWERCFTADRALLAVAGGVQAPEIRAAWAAHCADWPSSTQPRVPPPTASSRPGVVQPRRDFSTALVELAWPAPALDHAEVAALDVLSTALGEGGASLLDTRLQREEELAFDIWSELSARPLGGQLSVGFVPREGRTLVAVTATLQEVARALRSGVPGSWVERARRRLLTDLLFGHETVEGRAHDLGWYGLRTADPLGGQRYAEAVAQVGPQEVHHAARWLAPERAVMGLLDATLSPGAGRRLTRARRPVSARHPHQPVHLELSSGARLVILPDGSPVAALRAMVVGGHLAERPRLAGRARAWAAMVTAGAGDLDAPGLTEAIDAVSANLEGVVSQDCQGLSCTFPAAWCEDILDLVGAVLHSPRFEAGEWPRVREELDDELRTQGDRPVEIATQAAWKALYPGHPWALAPTGTLATLGRLGPRGLRAHHRALFTGPGTVVSVAGGVDPLRAQELLEPWLADLPPSPPALPLRPPPRPLRARRLVLHGGHGQAVVCLAVRGASRLDPERWPLDLAATLLAGQGGRLFLDLRERQGLAYDVWAEHQVALDGGLLLVGAATEPGRVEQVAGSLRQALQQLAHHGPTDQEILRARRVLVGLERMDWQTASARAAAAARGTLLGTPWLPEQREARLQGVSVADVAGALDRALSGGLVEIMVEPGT